MVLLLSALLVVGCDRGADSAHDTLRVGVLQYGTVNWELAVVRSNRLAEKRGVNLEIVELASEEALSEALHDGRVDVIVSDWLWVARQRTENRDYQFAPYSLAVGALMVNPGSDIETVEDLAGRRLGVAGGPMDKTWLLLRAYADRTADMKLERAAQTRYAEPPVLNGLVLDGTLPAAVNFWHYNARLEALGMRPLLTVETMLTELGLEAVPPLLGWVFRADWADDNTDALKGFLQASYEAKHILAESDEAWGSVRELVQPESEAVFAAIRSGYRRGIPEHYREREIEAAKTLFGILVAEAGGELTGGLEQLPDEVFWGGFRLQ